MQRPCGFGKSPKSFSAPADGGQLRVNVGSAFGPSRLSAPARLWTLDQLTMYQMGAWEYSALAMGHSMSYTCACVCCVFKLTLAYLWLHLSTHLTCRCSRAFHSALIKLPVFTLRQFSISCRSQIHQTTIYPCYFALYLPFLCSPFYDCSNLIRALILVSFFLSLHTCYTHDCPRFIRGPPCGWRTDDVNSKCTVVNCCFPSMCCTGWHWLCCLGYGLYSLISWLVFSY